MTTRERMHLAFEEFYGANRMPNQPDNAAELARAMRWAKDCFFEGYLAGFNHAADTAQTAMREAQDVAVNHDIPT